jgi:hypothetical protein
MVVPLWYQEIVNKTFLKLFQALSIGEEITLSSDGKSKKRKNNEKECFSKKMKFKK